MQNLLHGGESAMRDLRRGDVVEGTVVRIGPEEILVDVGAKSDGIIPARELSQRPDVKLNVGEKILVYVVQPENKEGNIILSLARAQLEHDWREAERRRETGETFELDVIGYNRGGLIARFGEIRGFIPASQVFELRGKTQEQPEQKMAKMVGKRLRLKVIEVDRGKNRLILSETAASREWRSEQKDRLLAELKEGEIRHGRVSGLADFGAFVDIGGADGLIHLSELSWQPVQHPQDIVQVGQEVDVLVLSVDREKKRIALSLKRTQPEPWDRVMQKYHVGDLVQATITKLTSFGAFARLDDGVEGLVHISELSDAHIAHPKNVVSVGDVLTLRIVRIEPERRRLGLSLKQVHEPGTGEAMDQPMEGPRTDAGERHSAA
jgi:small subunit ribosomal protein S1